MKATTLKLEMVKMGVTQSWLADQAGISRGMVNLLANGKTRPGLKTAFKIAEAIGVSVDYLWGTQNNRP